MAENTIAGRRVLVVEDEYFIADDLDGALRGVGVIVLGPVPSVDFALDLLKTDSPDAAVLDVNLSGELAWLVADELLARHVPFLITTGYDRSAVPERFAAVRRLEKPVERSTVLRELTSLLGGNP